MTRTEEQLQVSTQQVAATRARLVKYVVTEEVTITVPIRREEIRLEHVALDAPDTGPGESLVDDRGTGPAGQHAAGQHAADRFAAGGSDPGASDPGASDPGGYAGGGYGTGGYDGGGLPEEIVLHAERPVVTVEVVPVERVRLRTELVEGQEQVTEQVQREQIVVDESGGPRR